MSDPDVPLSFLCDPDISLDGSDQHYFDFYLLWSFPLTLFCPAWLIKDLLLGHSTMTKCKCQKFNCKVQALGTFIDL